MAKTVPAEGELCHAPGLHRRTQRALERRLLEHWTTGAELLEDFDVEIECIPSWSPDGGSALLSAWWLDMPCGCVFGALQVVHLEGLDSGAA